MSGDEPGHTVLKVPNSPLGPASGGTFDPTRRDRSISETTIEQDCPPSVRAGSIHKASGTTTDPQD
ncbi:MAG: hypothetical protein GDA68_04895 [Nitrospira sp. CR2.1]|nr:hypothetical protein [Nitrospira sp. CR2.1]